MFAGIYYLYKKQKHGVLFNGEISDIKIFFALEMIVYCFLILLSLPSLG